MPTIRALRDSAERARRHEVEHALKLLARGDEPVKVLDALSHGLTNKLLHAPTVALKAAAASAEGDEVLRAARGLFALDVEPVEIRGEVTGVRVQGEVTAKAKAGNGR